MCPLCLKFDGQSVGSVASMTTVDSTTTRVECWRCGAFLLKGGPLPTNLDERILLRLSGLARAFTDEGSSPLEIANDNAPTIAARAAAPQSSASYFDSLLLLIGRRCKYPGGDTGQLQLVHIAALSFLPLRACLDAIMAQERYVKIIDPDALRFRCRLTQEGWQRFDELTRETRVGSRAFVAMWFDATMADAYQNGLRPALIACGYEPPFRVDDPQHDDHAGDKDFHSRIDDRILAEIRRARFLVADATGRRASVYYEAGFADGLGIPVIWTCRKDAEDDMAFDTRQHEHILWSDPDDLRLQLTAKIERRGWQRR